MERLWPHQKTTPPTCFGKHSCCGCLNQLPKINIPINTVAAPCNSLPGCSEEASFVNLLLKTWTETSLLNTSVGGPRVHVRAHAFPGSAPALWHSGSRSPRWSCGRGAAKETLGAVGPCRRRERDFGRVLLTGLSRSHPNPAAP